MSQVFTDFQEYVAQIGADKVKLHHFIHGAADETVSTESGPIPTLAGLVEEIGNRGGVLAVPDIAALRALTGVQDGQIIKAATHSDGVGGGDYAVTGDDAGQVDNNGTLLIVDSKVLELLGDIVSPETFGFPPTTISDQDAAIDNAVAAAGTAFLRGNYRVTDFSKYMDSVWGPGRLNGIALTYRPPFRGVGISAPPWWSWNSGFTPVWDGSKWTVKESPKTLDVASAAPGKVERWVNVDTGSDSNDGTEGAPWKGVWKALLYAQENQASIDDFVVHIAAGFYDRTVYWPAAGQVPTNMNISLIAEGGDVYLAKVFEPQTWTNTTGNVWQATRSQVTSVRDRATLDDGYWTQLENVGTTSGEITGPGQWATDGTTVWVWMPDGREPDGDVMLFFAPTGAYLENLEGVFYSEGIYYIGGASAFVSDADDAQIENALVFNGGGFLYSLSSNGLTVFGCRRVYNFGTTVAKNYRDGLNYHESRYNTPIKFKALEVAVTSEFNGNSGDSNNNASSAHDGGAIMRVGGDYSTSEGPILPDVNGCDTWGVGVVARDSNSPASGSSYNYFCQGAGRMHLDYCESYGSESDVVIDEAGGAVFTANNWTGGSSITYL